jgi:MYXO-CTERM domain-containing protein
MNPDPASLDHLRDIVVPEPAPFWPPTTGWVCLLGVLALAAVMGLAWWRRRHHLLAYRRQALEELARLRQDGPTAAEVSRLLKRVALATAPRDAVAGLSGDRWVEWLGATAPGLPPAAARSLLGVHAEPETPAPPELLEFASAWIRLSSPAKPC